MGKRMLISLCAVLVVLGPTFAQLPDHVVESSDPGNGSLWVTADYLLAWFRTGDFPALVTTSSPGTARSLAGVIGNQNTSTLFGGNGQYGDLRAGFRIAAGMGLSQEYGVGAEIGVRYVVSETTDFQTSSDRNGILARPFTNALNSQPQAVLVAFPGSSTGAITVEGSSGNFYDGWFDLNHNFYKGDCCRINWLLGYRYYRYDERLTIGQTILPTTVNFPADTQIRAVDNFGTKNEFHAVDVGIRWHVDCENVSLSFLGKVAVGNLRREVNIGGLQTVASPGVPVVTRDAGVLALSGNSGNFVRDVVTMLPEVGCTVGWQATSNVRLTLGYSALVLMDVARAADQIDTIVNPNLFPPAQLPLVGPSRPAFTLEKANVWIQSVNLGVEFVF